MFAAAGKRHVVGGNIGVGLLSLLDEITPETSVILEVSHTQLELTDRSPHVACVLNVTPNHLDRYGWPDYVGLKRNILRYQTKDDLAVLGYDDEVARSLAAETQARVAFFCADHDIQGPASVLKDGAVVWREGGIDTPVMPAADIPLRGRAQRVERAGGDGDRVGVRDCAGRYRVGGARFQGGAASPGAGG